MSDCCIRLKGSPVTAGWMKDAHVDNGKIKIFGGGATAVTVNEESVKDFTIIKEPSVLIKSRGVIDVEYCDVPYTFKQEMWAYKGKPEVNNKYLYYILTTKVEQLRKIGSKMGSMPQIKLEDTEDLKIPVPPLSVQEKIVEILDNFDAVCNSLSIGLPAEISAREKQYNFYRDQLLTFIDENASVRQDKTRQDKTRQDKTRQDKTIIFNDIFVKLLCYVFDIEYNKWNCNILKKYNGFIDIESKKLNEVLNYEQPSKYIVEDTNYDDTYKTPVLTAGQSFILGYTNEAKGIYNASKKEPVVIFDDFTTSSHWVDFDFKVKSSAIKLLKPLDTSKYNFKYCYYCMKNIKYETTEHARQWISKYSEIKIELPPIEIQNEIVDILDNFNDYTNSMETGLKGEIEKNNQRYEYWRDKLLSFEKEN